MSKKISLLLSINLILFMLVGCESNNRLKISNINFQDPVFKACVEQLELTDADEVESIYCVNSELRNRFQYELY